MESFWEKERKNHKKYDAVKENLEVSVCIIGGGLTGLSTAYYLSKDLDVAVVEKDKICSHTSGKNTGKVTSQHGLFYKYLIDSEDKSFAKKYMKANEKAINNIESIINNEKIKCDFERECAYVFTRKKDEVYKIKEEEKAIKKIKPDICKTIEDISLPVDIECAIRFKDQAMFHPIKYAYGLADCIEKNQGSIYEDSHVTDIKKQDDKYIVYVNEKQILADYVVICTRYPIITIPGYYFLKMYQSTSFAIVVETKEKLFDGMYISSETPTISFRTVNDNGRKLLLAVGYDYKTGTGGNEDGYNKLENVVKQMYPDENVLYKWIAEDCITLDKIPYIGDFSTVMPNVYVATGFNKWGLTTSNIAANIITDKILGKQSKYAEIFESKRMEPIKNRQEVGNMLKEAGKSLIGSKFKIPKEKLDDVKIGEGKIINVDNNKIGVYKDENGEIFAIKPVCTHLGCELSFNNIDKIWECPCHGSKFTYDGVNIEGPSNKDLK